MEWVSGNVFIRPNGLERAGDRTDGHTHNFDHTMIVLQGAVRVVATRLDGPSRSQDFTAPAHCLIEAGACHAITALTDNVIYWCVFSHRTPQGEISQENTGWIEAYGG